ncbi:MAG TPA: aldehyde dehydrogenase family protein, partial [Miltoncostaeaceae bacterium]|nr:aldehyde dehydrogenase family protein [Miltoncostaeaceae bacterium]
TVQERAINVIDPAHGTVLGLVDEAGEDGAAAAAEAAAAAQRGWARTAPAERGEALRAAAAALRARARDVAALQSRENGRPLAESLGGVMAGAGTLEEYGAMAAMPRGRTLAGAWDATDFAAPEPRGVAAALVPWNDPVAIACGPIGACLAAGNAIVVKPSEKTPLSTMLLADVLAPHLPPDVLRVITGGPETGRALIGRREVQVVLHTGSVATGRAVAAECGRRLVKAVLELGGKDPLIVDEDVDPEWAAGQAASGAFANAGQVCTSVERIYVHRAVAPAFIDALAARAGALRPGDPLEPSTTLGPLIDAGQRDVVEDHLAEAIGRGAEAVAGGARLDGEGFFHQPTVLTGVDDGMRVMREETFGPVAAVRTVDSFGEALRLADEGDYGLAATVLTRSQANAQRAWRELQVGTVKINAVWGGAPGGSAEPRRGSGMGLGYGPGLLREVSAQKVVHMEPAP